MGDLLLLIASQCVDVAEKPQDVVRRLIGYASDRAFSLGELKRAGYQVELEPQIIYSLKPLVEQLVKDLQSGRATISFLSSPPKVPVERLPIGGVFVHDGRLLEVKREPTVHESQIICYLWNRDERPSTVDRKQLVAPLGRVTFDDRRKGIKLGLLELKAEEESFINSTPQIESKKPSLYLSSPKKE